MTQSRLDRTSAQPEIVLLDDLHLGSVAIRSAGIDEEWVRHLVDTSDRWPPIVISQDGHVIDGHHRVVAARRLGLRSVQARRSDASSDISMLEAAIAANSAHGLPLTRADRRLLVDRLLLVAPTRSDRRIAATVGVSPTTVGNRRRLLLEPLAMTDRPGESVQFGHGGDNPSRDCDQQQPEPATASTGASTRTSRGWLYRLLSSVRRLIERMQRSLEQRS